MIWLVLANLVCSCIACKFFLFSMMTNYMNHVLSSYLYMLLGENSFANEFLSICHILGMWHTESQFSILLYCAQVMPTNVIKTLSDTGFSHMACFVAYSEILGDYAQVNLFENETLGIGLIFPAIPTKDFLN